MNWELLKTNWEEAWTFPQGEQQFKELLNLYGQPQRHYHTLEHIGEMLLDYERAKHLVQHPQALLLAIFYHDSIYRPGSKDNEECSADLASNVLREAHAEEQLISKVDSLILTTKKHPVVVSGDAAILSDLDIAILGMPPDRFGAYDCAIREEFAFTPYGKYVGARIAVLEGFLARQHIFHLPLFRQAYEGQARANVHRLLGELYVRSG
ncbi:MAG: N-methyl-D-aspartate receptor NMDAR2C subunit [archaeon]